jgi:hypothetical protein
MQLIYRGESKNIWAISNGWWKERRAENEKDSDSGRAGSKLLANIGAFYRKIECQKKPRTVAASSAKLRKVAASNSRARSGVNQTITKGRKDASGP